MKDNQLPATCNQCSHAWPHDVQLPMEMSEFIKMVKKIRCPRCESKSIGFDFSDGAERSRAKRDYDHG